MSKIDPLGLSDWNQIPVCACPNSPAKYAPPSQWPYFSLGPCCAGKSYDPQNNFCINGRIIPKNQTEEVTITFRKASLPGGGAANMVMGKGHCSVTTTLGESGMGKLGAGVPGQGAEGFAYTLRTEMVDHTGQNAIPGVINVKVKVNSCCFLNRVSLGTKTGVWIPLINDCNVVVKDAVNNCGGDWDKAYAEYLDQNIDYHKYWDLVGEGLNATRGLPKY